MPKPQKTTGGFDDRVEFKCHESWKKELEAFANETGVDMSKVLRDGADNYLRGYLPVLGHIPCGPLAEAIPQVEEYELCPPYMRPRRDLGDFWLVAEGSSMEPSIRAGDLVHMRPNSPWGNGQVCAVQVFYDKNHGGDCDAALKRVYKQMGSKVVTLKSDNPDFDPVEVDATYVKVVGVYRSHLRRDG